MSIKLPNRRLGLRIEVDQRFQNFLESAGIFLVTRLIAG
jgi:hypothetical protein